jgi:hypothetical protein
MKMEMGAAFRTHGTDDKYLKIIVGENPEDKRVRKTYVYVRRYY